MSQVCNYHKNKDGSVTICGKTYYPDDSSYRIVDGEVYVEDENHFGTIWVTEAMVDKYGLRGIAFAEDEDDDFYWKPDDLGPEFNYTISIDHACGFIDPATGEVEMMTPNGHAYDEEFVAWWNDFPVKLLKEDGSKVFIACWADG